MRTAVVPVWVLLMVVTAVNFWLGVQHGLGHGATRLTTVAIMLLAFLKVRFIGMYFMELRHAPAILGLLFQGWCTVVGAAVVLVYLVK